MELGKNIAKLRDIHKMTAIELAKKIGVNPSHISQIENGKKFPSIEVLQKIAKTLNTTISELLDEVPEQTPAELRRLVDAAKNLDDKQIDALIEVIEAFGNKE